MILSNQEASFERLIEQRMAGGVVKRVPVAFAFEVPVRVDFLTAGAAQRIFGLTTKAKAVGYVDRGLPVEPEHRLRLTAGDGKGEVLRIKGVLPVRGGDVVKLELEGVDG